MTTIRAYCYASGRIEFGEIVPDGALAFGYANDGPSAQKLRDYVSGLARHGYEIRTVKGRPTKIPGTDALLVPGVPEAPDQGAALDALHAFMKWAGKSAPRGVHIGA